MKIKQITAVLCVVILLLSGCTDKNDSYTSMTVNPSEDDGTWETIDVGTAVLENDSICFELNTDTTHFTVKDKISGQFYSSVPGSETDIMSEEAASRLLSEITVCYSAEQTGNLYMYSDTDSVKSNNFTVKTNGAAIRVYYSMGTVDRLLPIIFTKEMFEDVLSRFESSALMRRTERAYVLYSSDDKPDDYNEKLKLYPVLSERPLYILSDVLSDTDKDDISTDIKECGFTEKEYKTMLDSIRLGDIEEDSEAGFLIPVEYRLTGDGFTASILSDRIEEKSKEFKIHSVDMLEYFYAFTDGTDSAFFVPDGSGAIINLNNRKNVEFSKPFYGEDITLTETLTSGGGASLTLPVYGIKNGNKGVFSIVEEAAENAVLKAYSSNEVTPFNRIYSSFVLRSIDSSSDFNDAGIAQFNMFAAKRIAASPRVRYCLLESGKNSYFDMATIYRSYLSETKKLPADRQTDAPVYIDYLCMITEDASFLGIPYTKKTVLSTVSEIIASVKKLQNEGIRGITVRLLGYGSSGLNNGAYNHFDIDRRVGTVEELEKLSEMLSENGGKLYLDADIQLAYKNGNGFKASKDAARRINRKIANFGDFDFVTCKLSLRGSKINFVSPICFNGYTADFIKDLKKSFGFKNLPGLSYGTFGLYLGGDYSPQHTVDRTESRKLLTVALDGVYKDNAEILFDCGNAYVLPYASGLLNTPLNNSQLLSESECIPFYQLVIHGSIPYAGGPENMAENSSRNYLKTIEYGAAPYAAFITREDTLISYTEWQTKLFSLSDKTRIDTFIKHIKDTDKLRRETLNKKMTAHKKLSDTLFYTVYEGGYTVYVNYGDTSVAVNGVNIPARGYSVRS